MTSSSSTLGLMSSGEVARRLDLSTNYVSALVESGVIVCLAHTKGGRVFDRDHIEQVAAARAEAARHDRRVRPPAAASEPTP